MTDPSPPAEQEPAIVQAIRKFRRDEIGIEYGLTRMTARQLLEYIDRLSQKPATARGENKCASCGKTWTEDTLWCPWCRSGNGPRVGITDRASSEPAKGGMAEPVEADPSCFNCGRALVRSWPSDDTLPVGNSTPPRRYYPCGCKAEPAKEPPVSARIKELASAVGTWFDRLCELEGEGRPIRSWESPLVSAWHACVNDFAEEATVEEPAKEPGERERELEDKLNRAARLLCESAIAKDQLREEIASRAELADAELAEAKRELAEERAKVVRAMVPLREIASLDHRAGRLADRAIEILRPAQPQPSGNPGELKASEPALVRCDFCGSTHHEAKPPSMAVVTLIKGNGAHICERCVDIAAVACAERRSERHAAEQPEKPPEPAHCWRCLGTRKDALGFDCSLCAGRRPADPPGYTEGTRGSITKMGPRDEITTGLVGSVDAAHRETAVATPSGVVTRNSTQPTEAGRSVGRLTREEIAFCTSGVVQLSARQRNLLREAAERDLDQYEAGLRAGEGKT
jgi:hypothetical protein